MRSTVRTETNDGGAWLVKQDAGVIGQVDRAAMEVSGFVSGPQANSDFDVEQTDSIVLMNDRGGGKVILVDPRLYKIINETAVPKNVHSMTVHDGAVLWTESPLKVWHLTRSELSSVKDLAEVEPVVAPHKAVGWWPSRETTLCSPSTAPVTRCTGSTRRPMPIPIAACVSMPLGGRGEGVTAVSAIGDDALLMDDHSIAIVPASASSEQDVQRATSQVIEFDTGTDRYVLAQPAEEGSPLVVSPDGRVLHGDHAAAARRRRRAGGVDRRRAVRLGTRPAPADRLLRLCLHLSRKPVAVTRWCNGKVEVQDGLEGLDAKPRRCASVSSTGRCGSTTSTRALCVLGPDGEIQRLDDWGAAFGTEQQRERATGQERERRRQPNDDEAIVRERGPTEIDEDGKNEPPIAIHDEARTRVDQPIVVPCSTTTVIPTATSFSSPT